MDARSTPQAQREHPKRPPRRAGGFTLLEVMIAAALAVIVIAGLAAATMGAARTNREAAQLGAPERALHEALERIANDLRTNNGHGAYRCGRSGALTINDFDITWRTYRVTLDAAGQPTLQSACASTQDQATLLVRAATTDTTGDGEERSVHTRETIVSLTRGAAPTITSFTSDLTEVRPGDTINLTWRLAPDPPAGTITYLDGERVHTDPDTLTGATSVLVTQTSDYHLVADSPFGADDESLTVTAGNAPIFRVLRTEPERYIPGQALTFHWEIDPIPLRLQSASRLAGNGLAAQSLPTTPDASGNVAGQHTVTIPENRSGTLDFPFTAASRGGSTRKTVAVRECLAPTINLTADRMHIIRDGEFNTYVNVTWSTSNAVAASFYVDRRHTSLTGDQITSGSHRALVSGNPGMIREYTFTLTAESDCERRASAVVRVQVEGRQPPPPPLPDPDDPDPGTGAGDPSDPGGQPPPPLTCNDVDLPDVIYCACSEGPPPKVACLPQGDDGEDDPGSGGTGGGGPIEIDDD